MHFTSMSQIMGSQVRQEDGEGNQRHIRFSELFWTIFPPDTAKALVSVFLLKVMFSVFSHATSFMPRQNKVHTNKVHTVDFF
jgi:hypothetical protein